MLMSTRVGLGELTSGSWASLVAGAAAGQGREGYWAWMSQPRYIRASTASVTNWVAWRASANV